VEKRYIQSFEQHPFQIQGDTIPALEQLWKNHEGDIGEAREVFQVIILIYSPNF